MRFYEITITDPNAPTWKKTYTSVVNGQNDPGALDIYFDLQVVEMTSYGVFALQILGIDLQTISQASNLNNKNIEIKAGSTTGLPLENPKLSGTLVKGFILQAFGNWIGTDMTLDLMISPGQQLATTTVPPTTAKQSATHNTVSVPPLGNKDYPINGGFTLPAQTPLATGLASFFKVAMPGFSVQINISPNLIWPYTWSGAYKTLNQFAKALKLISQALNSSTDYPGVSMFVDNQNTIRVFDGTIIDRTVGINFYELIGQPTWLDFSSIQLKTSIRSDLNVGDKIMLPHGFYGIAQNAPSAVYNYRNRSAQTGTFVISEVRHVGHYRQPTADAWVTIVTALAPTTPGMLSNG